MTIYLDFFSGSHGHFLEYVINTWLFKGPRVPNIFTNLGTCHNIRQHNLYMSSRVVHSEHYSEFNKNTRQPEKIVRITINKDWAKWIYQINVVSRAGDIPIEKKMLLLPDTTRQSPNCLRNDWYSKFNLDECGYRLPGNWRNFEVPVFEFPMESLFDLQEFYSNLYKLASFLEITFVPDVELAKLCQEFLDKNQGWQYYKQSCNVVENSLAGNHIEFTSNEVLQALINSMLTKSVGIFDGELFEEDSYPTNTSTLWNIVNVHLTTFDARF